MLQHGLNDSRFEPVLNMKYSGVTCHEKVNFVYLKMIKCASETLTAMFHSFGHSRNLSFVLPLDNRIYVGWPYSIQRNHFRPPKSENFNILCEHFVYNESSLKSIMPGNTIYLTSIREPYAQFKSTFNYYKIGKIIGLDNSPSSVSKYLRNIHKYEAVYQSNSSAKERFCIPDHFTMTKNLMSFNLGMPLGFPAGSPDISGDWSAVKDYVEHLGDVFNLVMIVEYMQESLVLLKRLMCWKSHKSILYRNKNIGKYEYKSTNNPEDVDLYKKRSPIDYYLYQYFNTTFWKKVNREVDFYPEVVHFKQLLHKFNSFCDENLKKEDSSMPVLIYPASTWSSAFNLTKKDCTVAGYEGEWYNILKDEYNRVPVHVKMPTNVPYFC